MKLIVGLGNIGKKYEWTRHNLGFMVVDSLAEDSWIEKNPSFSLIQKTKIDGISVLLAKPLTQMNLSGQAVKSLMDYYKIILEDLLVIQDDIDMQFLNIKFQKSRGAGGHNGIVNIHQHLGSDNYYRLKLGINPLHMKDPDIPDTTKPPLQKPSSVSSFVLSSFNKEEIALLKDFLIQASKSVQHFVVHGGESASQIYNQKSN